VRRDVLLASTATGGVSESFIFPGLSIVAGGTLTPAAGWQASRSAGLAAAMDKDVRGDLKGAIDAYREIADGKDRALAARALVRMAACHRKLGDAEARKLYDRVTREFADHEEAVADAKTGLAALGSTSTRQGGHLSVVSDTTNLAEDGEPAVPYTTPYSPRWTVSIPEAIWIWKAASVTKPLVDESHQFTKTFFIDGRPISGALQIAVDDDARVTINGAPVAPAA
jgi:hypothetical protein